MNRAMIGEPTIKQAWDRHAKGSLVGKAINRESRSLFIDEPVKFPKCHIEELKLKMSENFMKSTSNL